MAHLPLFVAPVLNVSVCVRVSWQMNGHLRGSSPAKKQYIVENGRRCKKPAGATCVCKARDSNSHAIHSISIFSASSCFLGRQSGTGRLGYIYICLQYEIELP